jgi:hypothetical protein
MARAKKVEVVVTADAVVVDGQTHGNGATVKVSQTEAKRLEQAGAVRAA